MKSRIVLTSIFAIVLFAVAASAQHVKVIDGSKLVPIRPSTSGSQDMLSFDTSSPTVRAGSTVHPFGLVGQKGALMSLGGINSLVYQVPCDGTAVARSASGASTAQLTITGTISDPVLNWRTDKSWKGTCRALEIKARDGTRTIYTVSFDGNLR